tara:strand:- start:17375 stop:17599 length:225 start_codon:yes stop_codon:yes gene_type:complete
MTKRKQVIWFNIGWTENSRGKQLLEWLNTNGFEKYNASDQTHYFYERSMQKNDKELLPEGITLRQIINSVIEHF